MKAVNYIGSRLWNVSNLLNSIFKACDKGMKCTQSLFTNNRTHEIYNLEGPLEFKLKKLSKHEEEIRKERKSWNQRRNEDAEILRSMVISVTSKAKAKDYQKYLQLRTKPCSHYYDYDMRDIRIAHCDMILPNLCGAYAVKIIAPKGITVKHKDDDNPTHNRIYDMDDPDKETYVPSYNDAQECCSE